MVLWMVSRYGKHGNFGFWVAVVEVWTQARHFSMARQPRILKHQQIYRGLPYLITMLDASIDFGVTKFADFYNWASQNGEVMVKPTHRGLFIRALRLSMFATLIQGISTYRSFNRPSVVFLWCLAALRTWIFRT